MKSWWKFVVMYEAKRFWEQRAVWWVLALIPAEVKKWIVVQSAVKAEWEGNPGLVTYREMVNVWAKS